MRGTLAHREGTEAVGRNTPADAGNSRSKAKSRAGRRKHPRRCGELPAAYAISVESAETPPQMRGTLFAASPLAKAPGNTPADAGNSLRRLRRSPCWRKHPRRCGELFRVSRGGAAIEETPPQMRGTPLPVARVTVAGGNTPADAGNSFVRGLRSPQPRKHPRRCGELHLVDLVAVELEETPPQMRGTQQYIEFQPNQITIS